MGSLILFLFWYSSKPVSFLCHGMCASAAAAGDVMNRSRSSSVKRRKPGSSSSQDNSSMDVKSSESNQKKKAKTIPTMYPQATRSLPTSTNLRPTHKRRLLQSIVHLTTLTLIRRPTKAYCRWVEIRESRQIETPWRRFKLWTCHWTRS